MDDKETKNPSSDIPGKVEEPIRMSDFSVKGSPYSNEDRIRALATYAVLGNMKRVAEQTGIKYKTLLDWKQTDWWNENLEKVRKQKQDELDGMLTGVITECVTSIMNRIAHGEQYIKKDGSVGMRDVGFRDLAIVMGTLFDKRALIRGDVTSRIERTTTEDTLNKILNSFKSLAKDMNSSQDKLKDVKGNRVFEAEIDPDS